LAALQAENASLARRLEQAEGIDDAVGLWERQGVADAAKVLDMNAAGVRALRQAWPEPEGAA
jgi:hypothetical protein